MRGISTFVMCGVVAAGLGVGDAAAGPAVHLRFDVPGNLGLDSSGEGQDAELLNAPAYASGGVTGGALDLTGGAGYLRWSGASNSVVNLLDGDFTFSLWINTTQVFGADGSAAYQGAGIIYADVFGSPGGGVGDATPLALAGSRLTGLAGNDGISDLRSTSVVNTGEWFHVALRRTVGGTLDLFVNGQLESSVPTSSLSDLTAADVLILGGNTIDSRYFSGLIDEFQGYEGALSDGDIVTLFHAPGTTVPAPVASLAIFVGGAVSGRRRRA